jgi:hypothetical protein
MRCDRNSSNFRALIVISFLSLQGCNSSPVTSSVAPQNSNTSLSSPTANNAPAVSSSQNTNKQSAPSSVGQPGTPKKPSTKTGPTVQCSQLTGNETEGTKCLTSRGNVFIKVRGPGNFGLGWKDPGGMIWSANMGKSPNQTISRQDTNHLVDSPATRMCEGASGRLPSIPQYTQLRSYFSGGGHENDGDAWMSKKDFADLNGIFPEIEAETEGGYWTSSVDAMSDSTPTGFGGSGSYFGSILVTDNGYIFGVPLFNNDTQQYQVGFSGSDGGLFSKAFMTPPVSRPSSFAQTYNV